MASLAMPKELSAVLRQALVAISCDGQCARLAEQYEPNFYREIDNVLKAVGGRWIARQKCHVFPGDAKMLIDAVVASGVKPDGNKFDFYPTPEPVLDLLFTPEEIDRSLGVYAYHCATPEAGPFRILEPQGGSGSIARRLRDLFPQAEIQCVEIDPVNVAALRAQGFQVHEGDFLRWEPEAEARFHLCVMNPPFNGTDYIKHVRRAFGFLRPGGILRAVVPLGAVEMTGKASADFAYFVARHGHWSEPLIDAFVETGTKVKTVVVGLTNDDESWRENRFEGFRSWHAFALALLIDQDRELQERASSAHLTREEFVSLVHMAARRCFVENREPVVVTDDVVRDLEEHYEVVRADVFRAASPIGVPVAETPRNDVELMVEPSAKVQQQEFAWG